MITKLQIGEAYRLSINQLHHLDVVYAGMPNQDTFSIVRRTDCPNQITSYNLFYPKDHREIKIKFGDHEFDLEVKNVTPEEILLEYVENEN